MSSGSASKTQTRTTQPKRQPNEHALLLATKCITVI